MNKDVKEKWLAALRSGEYVQGRNFLHRTDDGGMCCLGVLCDLAVKEGVVRQSPSRPEENAPAFAYDGATQFLPTSVMNWAGLHSVNPEICYSGDTDDDAAPATADTLSELNDEGGDFELIADVIEEQL